MPKSVNASDNRMTAWLTSPARAIMSNRPQSVADQRYLNTRRSHSLSILKIANKADNTIYNAHSRLNLCHIFGLFLLPRP
jgi:hypothetical protein